MAYDREIHFLSLSEAMEGNIERKMLGCEALASRTVVPTG